MDKDTMPEFLLKYGQTALQFYLLGIARELLPNERINVCWRYPLPARKTIEIIYSDERERARVAGTMKCGSGWVCPACMRYIAERRRLELETAMQRSSERYFTVMCTYTARHQKGTPLRTTLDGLLAAYKSTFSGRWWADAKPEYMVRGAIRATEITYGANGWHPHFHVLMFVDKAMLSDDLAGSPEEFQFSVRNQFGSRWLESLEKHGLSGNAEHSFDVRTSDELIADYITKFGHMPQDWSLNASAYEIAHNVTKNARKGNFSVLDILFEAAHDTEYKCLFLEYHQATKGKSALQWSPGLKRELDIEVIRDEIAAQGVETETDRLLAEIDVGMWRVIADKGHLGQVMTYANSGNREKLENLIDRIGNLYKAENWTIPQMDIGIG